MKPWKTYLKNIFHRSCRIKNRGMYAITGGDRVGGFIIRISEYDSYGAKAFLFIPEPTEAILLTNNDISNMVEGGYLEYVETIKNPKAYEVIRENWKYFADKQQLIYEHH